MKGKRSFLLITVFISFLMFITGCWESDKTNTPSENQNITLTAITVSPSNPSLNIGETIQFNATGTYSDNSTKNITDSVTWTSSNIAVSNIIARGISSLSGGLASAIAPGTTLITATLDGITSPARTLIVSSTIVTSLESITVSPATASISLGAGNSFTAIGAYDDGSTKEITNLVTWISSDEAIATIEAGGYTAPQSVGTTQITATLYGITSIPGTLTVTNPTLTSIDVTPANPSVNLGGTKQFIATGTYSNSSTQIITNTVTWASSNEAIATIGVEGLATAQTVGDAQITAALDGITSDPQTLSVVASLESIVISPTNPSISLGGTQQFTATGTYYDESTQDLTDTVTWASSNEEAATIGTDGLATAQSIGETEITATIGGVTASAQTLSVCVSSNILMGEIPITDPNQVEDAFNTAVQAVRNAVQDMTPVTWMIMGEIPMPFPEESHGTLLEVGAPMFADDAMAMGQHHALGMPCKIGIWTEDSDEDNTDDLIKINILSEAVVFSFFFADVMGAEGFDDFAEMIKAQMKGIVQTAVTNLNGNWIYEYQPPFYTQEELTAIQSWVTSEGGYAGESGYGLKLEVPLAGNKDEGQSDPNFLSEVKNNIMSAIGNTPYARDDWHVINQNFNIPVGDYTDPNNPFATIGEIKLCSGYYASQVIGMGGKYMLAMPCAVSVWLNDLTMDSQGMPAYQQPDKVIVGILNPEFILQNYFKDIVPLLPATMQEQMANMGAEIKNQVLSMVNNGLKEYSYPNHLFPRLSTNILMGKIAIAAEDTPEDAFNTAVLAVRDAVSGYSFIPQQDSNSINPWKVVGEIEMPFPEGSYGTLLEVCAPMFADDAMSMGQHHAVGMPCKIGVWTEDSDEDGTDDLIKINTLDESAIFAFYFADVMSAEGFDDFAAMIKTQMKEMVKSAVTELDGDWIFEHQPPFFTHEELVDVQSWTTSEGGYAGENGYAVRLEIPLAGNIEEGQSDVDFLKEIKNNIISMIDIDDDPPYDARADWHVIDPNFIIPVGDYTDPNNPFTAIGEIKLCSSYYAEMVVGLGGQYMVAMPCTISVWLNDLTWDSQGMPIYQTPDKVIISILNPEFILENYFSDLPEDIQGQLAGMGAEIKDQVLAIVDHALTKIEVTPTDVHLSVGETQQFTAVLSYSDSNTKDITDEVIWSSSDESVAVISAEGAATAISFGEAQITATLDGVTSSPQILSVCIAGSMLMGEIAVSSAEEVEEAFNDAVQAVKGAIDEFSFVPEMFMNPINPFWVVVGEIEMPFPEGSYGRLLEVCAPMLADDAMAMGQHHALGMPCKIGIWTEDSDEDGTDDLIKINILNESFIFAVYFADVIAAEGFDQFEALVKDQMKEIVETAVTELGGKWIYEHQPPFYTQEELATLQSWVTDGGYAGENGYGMKLEIPLDPNKDAPDFLSEVKNNIISAIGHTPYARDDWHVVDPNFTIPVGDYTNVGNPFARIGEIKLCTPYYAGKVVGLGGQNMVAMPCTISVWLNDLTMDDQGMYTYQEPNKVIVGILNPEFILQNYFKDIIPTLPSSMQEQMADMGAEIKNQVMAMVNFGLKDYSYPNHLYPRVSTNILMGKVTISTDDQPVDAFDAAVSAVKNAVDEFVLEDSNSVTPWIVVGEAEMPFPAGSYGTLLETCAPMYADDAMSMGQHHALGMPCKIGVWTEDTDDDGIDDMVNINMLDESAIFAFFFADVMNAPGFDDFAAMIKNQTKEIVKTAVTTLDGEWIFEHQPPFFTRQEMAAVQSWVTDGGYAGESGYGIKLEVPLAWNKDDEAQSDVEFLSEIKDKIISAVGNTPEALSDWHVINKHFNIPVGDYTDPNNPFAAIGEIKLCSPSYAAQVVGLGGKYMTAMPCTISVWLNDLTWDIEGNPAYQEPDKVIVGILNPEFILQNYFKDLPADILVMMADMGPEIKDQVLAMVYHALEDLYLRGLWVSQFESVSGLARAYLDELKDNSKKPVRKADDLYSVVTNSDIMDDPFILSVRSFEHYQLGHIPEAVNIPWRSLADEESLLQLPTDDTQIVTYCYTGHTGQVAATVLNLLGYNAVNLKYGICSWTTDQEVRIAAAFKDPNYSHDFPIETTINPLSELEDYEAPVLNFDAESTQEIALAAAAAYLDSGSAPTITAQDLYYLISDANPDNDPFIISVRSSEHYQDPNNPNIKHIPGAYNVPYKNIADDEILRKLPTDQQIVTYCYTGHTGQLAATILNMLGYDAVNLKFGMMSWTRDPVARVVSPFTEGVDSHDYDLNYGLTP